MDTSSKRPPPKAPPSYQGPAPVPDLAFNAWTEGYDGGGGGSFVVPESGPNRLVAPSTLSLSAPAEVEGFDMAVDDDAEDVPLDDEDEAQGPEIFDMPPLENPSTEALYCTSCHQDVLVVHENICPACDRSDSTIGADTLQAKECREPKTVNHHVILSLELQDAIADQYVRRILARTPLEEGQVNRSGRLGFRLVGLASDDRFIFSGMRLAELAEGGVQPASPLTLLPSYGSSCGR